MCITVLMTSDNAAMQKIIRAGKLDQWIADSIGYCRDTFGSENVVAASLHLDEYTPHLHVAVVPIVTTERKREASLPSGKTDSKQPLPLSPPGFPTSLTNTMPWKNLHQG